MKARGSLIGIGLLFVASSADAAGLFVSDRGVRPLGRGGAFVAGADDLGAIWYNPAGLADAGSSILVDFSWVNYSAEFTRSSLVTDSNGTVRQVNFPTAKGTTPFLPIPTIAGSYNFGKEKQFTVAGGILVPYAGLTSYPLTVEGKPAASRYSLVSLEGSALVIVGGYFAYKPIKQFRVGIGVEALVGNFDSTIVFNSSPNDRLIGAPEDPKYDSLSKLSGGPIFAPSGNLGIIAEPDKHLRIGLSGQLPFWINAAAKVDVRLPTAAPFDRAHQQGNEAHVNFRLPAVLRAGVEYRTEPSPETRFRVEAAYVREFWSLLDSIDVRATGVQLLDITGFPSPFGVAPISLQKHFQDANSFRLGTELSVKNILRDYWLDFRAGASYETSAVPREWESAQTYDANKVLASAGGSVHIGEHWRMDGMATLALIDSTTVDPAEAQISKVNPVVGNPTKVEAINGGTYAARALILGVGLNYKF